MTNRRASLIAAALLMLPSLALCAPHTMRLDYFHTGNANTELFSVDQYRQSVAPYLGATLRMVRYQGELEFGLHQEDAGFIPSLDRFAEEWKARTDALAFVEPAAFEVLRARGLPMHVVARDARSIVIARSSRVVSRK